MNQRLAILLMLLSLLILITGCNISSKRASKDLQPPIGDISYQIINRSQKKMEGLKPEIINWYETNRTFDGLHSIIVGNNRYILLCAGEKPTSGYAIQDLSLIGEENDIVIKATLIGPKQGEIATAVITYPNLFFQIKNDNRQLVFENFLAPTHSTHNPIYESKDARNQAQTDSGRYIGQIDNNSIEIKISGVPDSIEAKTYRLSKEIMQSFPELSLKTGDQIIFVYIVNSNGQKILIDLRKID